MHCTQSAIIGLVATSETFLLKIWCSELVPAEKVVYNLSFPLWHFTTKDLSSCSLGSYTTDELCHPLSLDMVSTAWSELHFKQHCKKLNKNAVVKEMK